jgi:hypothetical protein
MLNVYSISTFSLRMAHVAEICRRNYYKKTNFYAWIFTISWSKHSVINILHGTGTTLILICELCGGMWQGGVMAWLVWIQLFSWIISRKLRIHRNQDSRFRSWDLNLGTTKGTTRVKIMASSYAAFDKKIVLMLRRNVLPPSSGGQNLVTVVSVMTGRRECVHYVAVLGTIQPE